MRTATESDPKLLHLPGITATLCSYENQFGPYHPQTLRLTLTVATAYGRAGELADAARLLERTIRDLERHLGCGSELHLLAIEALRDLWIEGGELARARATQRQLLDCRTHRLGQHHPETVATRDELITWDKPLRMCMASPDVESSRRLRT